MNLVAYKTKTEKGVVSHKYQIFSVKKEGNTFYARRVSVFSGEIFNDMINENKHSIKGGCLNAPYLVKCENERDARKKCRDMLKTKIEMQNYKEVDVNSVPECVKPFLLPDVDSQVTPDELLGHLNKIKSERYVVLVNNEGLEDCFDVGVQYLGYDAGDDNTIQVIDKFGEVRDIFKNRMSSIEKTEDATQF